MFPGASLVAPLVKNLPAEHHLWHHQSLGASRSGGGMLMTVKLVTFFFHLVGAFNSWKTQESESVHHSVLSQLFETPWTKAHLAPLSMGVSMENPSILEWVAISSSRGSSQQKDQTCFSCTGRGILYHWASWEACPHLEGLLKCRHGSVLPRVSDYLGPGLNLSLAFLASSQADSAAADWGLWSENHCRG